MPIRHLKNNLPTWESNDSKHITHNCLVEDIKLPCTRDERFFQQFLYNLPIYFSKTTATPKINTIQSKTEFDGRLPAQDHLSIKNGH